MGYSTHPLLVVVGLASSSEEGGVVTGTARTEAAGRRRMATAKAAAASHHTNRRVVNTRPDGCCTRVDVSRAARPKNMDGWSCRPTCRSLLQQVQRQVRPLDLHFFFLLLVIGF